MRGAARRRGKGRRLMPCDPGCLRLPRARVAALLRAPASSHRLALIPPSFLSTDLFLTTLSAPCTAGVAPGRDILFRLLPASANATRLAGLFGDRLAVATCSDGGHAGDESATGDGGGGQGATEACSDTGSQALPPPVAISDCSLVVVTGPHEASSRRLAQELVEDHLISRVCLMSPSDYLCLFPLPQEASALSGSPSCAGASATNAFECLQSTSASPRREAVSSSASLAASSASAATPSAHGVALQERERAGDERLGQAQAKEAVASAGGGEVEGGHALGMAPKGVEGAPALITGLEAASGDVGVLADSTPLASFASKLPAPLSASPWLEPQSRANAGLEAPGSQDENDNACKDGGGGRHVAMLMHPYPHRACVYVCQRA